MNLSKIIKHYRNCLSDLPDAPLYGNIPQGADRISEQLEQFLAPEHKQFLLLCNGGSFGDQKRYWIDNIEYQKIYKIILMK